MKTRKPRTAVYSTSQPIPSNPKGTFFFVFIFSVVILDKMKGTSKGEGEIFHFSLQRLRLTTQFEKKICVFLADLFFKFDSGRNIKVSKPPLAHKPRFSRGLFEARGNVGAGGFESACASKNSKWMPKK